MIITRTPFRLPLGGGGTDLPSYYTRRGGFFVSGAVDRYVHIAVNPRFEQDSIRVSYSTTEIVNRRGDIRHPLVREALDAVGIERGIEIVSVADAPASTGLGSSGSFCVGLLRALHAYLNEERAPHFVAEEACNIAMGRLREPSGKQDEYVAAFGGVRSYTIDRDGEVKVEALKMSTHTLAELEANIMMFYTGLTRSSSSVLSKQKEAIEDGKALEKMDRLKEIGYKVRDALSSGDLTRFGELLDEHWKVKRGVAPGMSNDSIDRWYRVAKENGALGGKVCGAGGGGFLMLYSEAGRSKLREAMAKEGLVEHRFHFEHEGSKIIYNV
jgi:D-glycero-alpha-D-manno-heptose-7-phosphate kinase